MLNLFELTVVLKREAHDIAGSARIDHVDEVSHVEQQLRARYLRYPIPLIRSVRLWSRVHESRRASWLELFFDLIFVAAVSQVGIPLGEDYTIHGLVRYSLMFLLIWWAWFGHTMYSTRFDADDVVHRLLTLVQIFAAAAMAANAKQ